MDLLVKYGYKQDADFFVKDLQSAVNQFGLAIGIQMLMWGMFAPIFGAMADKIGGNKVAIIAFVFKALGIYLLYSSQLIITKIYLDLFH